MNLVFTLSIKSACCFIENDDPRLAYEGSCNSNALLLSAREPQASLTDKRIKSLRELLGVFDETKGICLLASLPESRGFLLLACISKVNSVEDIVLYTDREQNGLLLNKCNLFLVIPPVVYFFDVLATKEYLTIAGIIEALKQGDNCRLSAARVAYNCYDLVLTNINRDSFQNFDLFGCFVAVLDIVQLDLRFLN